ncbi:MAG: hypothetical protein AAF687_05410 [Pseudomonadota bacterium]
MRTILLSIPCVAALALAACGSENSESVFGDSAESAADAGESGASVPDQATITATGPDGEEVVQSTGKDVPVALPKGITVYPEAKVISNQVTTSGNISNATVMLQSDAMPAEIVDFYRDQVEKADMELEIDVDLDVSKMLGSTRTSDGAKLTVSATRNEGETVTTVMLNSMSAPES